MILDLFFLLGKSLTHAVYLSTHAIRFMQFMWVVGGRELLAGHIESAVRSELSRQWRRMSGTASVNSMPFTSSAVGELVARIKHIFTDVASRT